MIAGWSVQALADESAVHRSVIDRWENGKVDNPLLSLYAALVKPLGVRVDLVGERHVPLMNLDDFEICALIEAAAGDGWRGNQWRDSDRGRRMEKHLRSALVKLGKINDKGVTDDAR